jgi:hypothetical protein
VRGGEADQNLILMDGYPIYNPFHVGGFVQHVHRSDGRRHHVDDGRLPRRYGGRLSSVLEVNSAEEARPGLHGTSEVSVLASTLQLGGAFAGGKASWSSAGRRTYADKVRGADQHEPASVSLSRRAGARVVRVHARDKLSFTLYDGRDALDANIAALRRFDVEQSERRHVQLRLGEHRRRRNAHAFITRDQTVRVRRWLLGNSGVFEQRASVSHFSTRLDLGGGALTLNNVVTDSRIGVA